MNDGQNDTTTQRTAGGNVLPATRRTAGGTVLPATRRTASGTVLSLELGLSTQTDTQ